MGPSTPAPPVEYVAQYTLSNYSVTSYPSSILSVWILAPCLHPMVKRAFTSPVLWFSVLKYREQKKAAWLYSAMDPAAEIR